MRKLPVAAQEERRRQVAIVVDVTFATDAPGIETKELGKHEFGSGAVISRGSTINPHSISPWNFPTIASTR